MVIAIAVPRTAIAQQTPSAADGPWSGQVQCALSTRAANYQDDQIHTWRITGGPPAIAGSVRNWPGVWSVQGSGRRTNPPEQWTVNVPERSVPISMSDVPVSGRIHIASTHAQLVASGALQVTGTTAQTILTSGSVYEWLMPAIEDAGTATTISGTRTRTLQTGYSWQRPFDAVTTETCTWNFSRVMMSAQSAAPAGAATLAPTLTAAAAGTIQTAPGGTTSGTTSTTTTRRLETLSTDALSALNSASTTSGSSTGSGSSGTGTVHVTAPNGGETWLAGSHHMVEWQSTYGNTQYYDVAYSGDGGATWTQVTRVQDTGILFVVPTTPSSRALINVTAHGGTGGDTSDATFRVVSKVTVTSPNGGETLTGGMPVNITWTPFGLSSPDPFTAEVSYDSGTTWVTTPASGVGQMLQWTVSGPATTHARIRVRTSDANGPVMDESDADFTIAP